MVRPLKISLPTTPTPCRLFQKRNWLCSQNTNATWNTFIHLQADQFHLRTTQMVNTSPLSTPEKTICEHQSNCNNKQFFFTNKNATPTLHAIRNINDNNSQGDLLLTKKLSRTNKNFDDSIILNILQNNFRHLKNKFWKRVWIFTLKNQDMTSSNWWTIYFGFAEIYNSETFFILHALLKRPWCNGFD